MIYRAPGVYIKETDASLYVKQSASAVMGFVGVADKGPVGVATLITHWAQFEETFGGFRAEVADQNLAQGARQVRLGIPEAPLGAFGHR